MAIWLLLGTTSCYVNAADPDEAYQKYVDKFPLSAGNPVTVYELPQSVEDFQGVICWGYGPD